MSKKSPNWQTFSRRLDWNLLKVFHQIAQSGGISNAARVLLRKQPAVSASLRQLESHLQVKLCERGPAGFKLTAEGEKMFELAEEMVRLVRSAPDDINTVLGELTGTLKIGMISNIILPALDTCLRDFAAENPRMRLNISVQPWEAAVNSVLDGENDIAVVYQRVPKAELHYQWLSRETQNLYCGPTHELYQKTVSDPMTLSDEEFLLTGLDEAEEVASFRLRYSLGARVKATSEDLSELRRMIQIGVGIGFLPRLNSASTENQSALWPLLAESVELPNYNLWVVSAKPHKRSPGAERFVATVDRVMNNKLKKRGRPRLE